MAHLPTIIIQTPTAAHILIHRAYCPCDACLGRADLIDAMATDRPRISSPMPRQITLIETGDTVWGVFIPLDQFEPAERAAVLRLQASRLGVALEVVERQIGPALGVEVNIDHCWTYQCARPEDCQVMMTPGADARGLN